MFILKWSMSQCKDVSASSRDKTHVDWVKAYIAIFTALQSYIKAHHTTGLAWSKSVSPPSSNESLPAEENLCRKTYSRPIAPSAATCLCTLQGPVASASAAPPSAPAGGCPPPPPGPPPPMDLSKPCGGGGGSGGEDRNALFASLNKGSDITKGREAKELFCLTF